MLWALVGVAGFRWWSCSCSDHRMLARYGYVCGVTGLILLVIPAMLPAPILRAERREDLDPVAGLLDSAR